MMASSKIGKVGIGMKKGANVKQGGHVKNFFVRIFHTLLMLGMSYFVILTGTILTPTLLAYILGGLGFGGTEVQSGAVFIVSMMAGFFLTGWIFIGSFMIIRAVWKLYVRNMRNTFSDEFNEKLDDLFKRK